MSETCRHFGEGGCGSCALIGLGSEAYQQRKQSLLASLVAQNLDPKVSVESLISLASVAGSRNKAKMVVGGFAHEPKLGFRDAEQKFIEIEECLLLAPVINRILSTIRGLIRECGIPPYSVERKKGELKYVIIRKCHANDSCTVRLVARSKDREPRFRALASKLMELHPEVKVVSMNIQPIHQAIMEGDEEVFLSNERFLVDEVAGCKLVYGPESFTQVTMEIAAELYGRVAEVVKEIRPKFVLDLFCGSGAFSFFVAPYADKVLGIEISEGAISHALEGVRANGVSNVEFRAADVESEISALNADGVPDLVIVNPPRRGLGVKITDLLLKLAPQNIVYSSCNPESLVNDLKALSQNYEVQNLTPFDMFPLTEHMEVLAVLTKKAL